MVEGLRMVPRGFTRYLVLCKSKGSKKVDLEFTDLGSITEFSYAKLI